MNARKLLFAIRLALAVLVILLSESAMQAAAPASGTLGGSSTKLTYTGMTTTENPATFDPEYLPNRGRSRRIYPDRQCL